MDNHELASQLREVQKSFGSATSALGLTRLIEEAKRLIWLFEVADDHESKRINKGYDIKQDNVGKLSHTVNKEVEWAKDAEQGRTAKKRAEASSYLNRAVSMARMDIDWFLSGMNL